MVTETFFPFRGGSAKRYLEVFKRIARKGYDVTLYTVKLKSNWPDIEEIEGIVVKRTPFTLANFITNNGFRSLGSVMLFTSWVLRKLQVDGPFDLIEANHCPIFPSYSSWLASKTNSTPLSITFHETWYNEWYRYVPRSIYAPIGIMLERSTTWLPDIAIAVSNATARGLTKYFGLPAEKVRVISNGVNLQAFNSIDSKKEEKILFTGRLNPHKKVEWLLFAYKRIKEQRTNLSLEIIGDGPYKEKYIQIASRLSLDDCYFMGHVDDDQLIRSYKEAMLYILPSIREGQSITLLEAMAAGTPQVAVDMNSSAASELLSRSKSGLLAKPDPNSIADASLHLLEDHELWRNARENGLEFVKQYDWDSVAMEHLDVYSAMIRR